jgi:hypothetical protein
LRRATWLLALLLGGTAPVASIAQTPALPPEPDPEEQVHWAVGAFFGTGWYRVDDNRSVFILRMTPRQSLRESALEADDGRQLGIEILYPLAFGINKLDDIPDFIDFDNYATISFTPGVALEVPVNERWWLRPFAHLGYGRELESGEGALIGYGGLRTRYRLLEGLYRWSAIGGLYYAAYKPDYGHRGQYGALMAGLEFNQPLGSGQARDDPLFLNWHLTYSWYFDNLNFHSDAENFASLRDQWELGVAIAKRDRPLELGFLSFEQIGLAYRWSSDGRFDAITINFRSPFTE